MPVLICSITGLPLAVGSSVVVSQLEKNTPFFVEVMTDTAFLEPLAEESTKPYSGFVGNTSSDSQLHLVSAYQPCSLPLFGKLTEHGIAVDMSDFRNVAYGLSKSGFMQELFSSLNQNVSLELAQSAVAKWKAAAEEMQLDMFEEKETCVPRFIPMSILKSEPYLVATAHIEKLSVTSFRYSEFSCECVGSRLISYLKKSVEQFYEDFEKTESLTERDNLSLIFSIDKYVQAFHMDSSESYCMTRIFKDNSQLVALLVKLIQNQDALSLQMLEPLLDARYNLIALISVADDTMHGRMRPTKVCDEKMAALVWQATQHQVGFEGPAFQVARDANCEQLLQKIQSVLYEYDVELCISDQGDSILVTCSDPDCFAESAEDHVLSDDEAEQFFEDEMDLSCVHLSTFVAQLLKIRGLPVPAIRNVVVSL